MCSAFPSGKLLGSKNIICLQVTFSDSSSETIAEAIQLRYGFPQYDNSHSRYLCPSALTMLCLFDDDWMIPRLFS